MASDSKKRKLLDAQASDDKPGSYASDTESTDTIDFRVNNYSDLTIVCGDCTKLFFYRFMLIQAGGVFGQAFSRDCECTELPIDGIYPTVSSYLNWAYRSQSARGAWLRRQAFSTVADLGRFAFKYAPFVHGECVTMLTADTLKQTVDVLIPDDEAVERKRKEETTVEFLVDTKCDIEPYARGWLHTAERAWGLMPYMPPQFWQAVIALGPAAAGINALVASIVRQDIALSSEYLKGLNMRIYDQYQAACTEEDERKKPRRQPASMDGQSRFLGAS